MTHIKRENINRARLQYKDALPFVAVKALGNSLWKKLKYKNEYLGLQELILTPDPDSDLGMGKDQAEMLEFRNRMLEIMPEVVRFSLTLFNPKFVEKLNLINADDERYESKVYPENLWQQILTSKSAFETAELFKTLKRYLPKYDDKGIPKPRKQLPPTPEADKLMFTHLARLEKVLNEFSNLDDTLQEELILKNVQYDKNSGYPFFQKYPTVFNNDGTIKESGWHIFREKMDEFCDEYLGGKPEHYTVNSILRLIKSLYTRKKTKGKKIILKLLKNFPYILFYRTQGGKKTKTRAVFGAFILLKLIASLLQIAQHWTGKSNDGFMESTLDWHDQNEDEALFTPPTIGEFKWIAAENWDTQFSTIANTMTQDLKSDTPSEWIGEDIIGFDMQVRDHDLMPLLNFKGPIMSVLITYVYLTLKHAPVWVGTNAVFDVFFKSGNPFTQLFGSYVHNRCHEVVEQITGWKRVHSILQSDDNLTAWDKFDLKIFEQIMKEIGFEISGPKTHVWSRDGYVVFLQIWLSYLFTDERIDFCGNLTSRLYGLVHVERDSESEDVGIWDTFGDNAVDQYYSKLGSFGDRLARLVSYILTLTSGTSLGIRTIQSIDNAKAKGLKAKPKRPDVIGSLGPDWIPNLVQVSLEHSARAQTA
jgi:hypothetical protein